MSHNWTDTPGLLREPRPTRQARPTIGLTSVSAIGPTGSRLFLDFVVQRAVEGGLERPPEIVGLHLHRERVARGAGLDRIGCARDERIELVAERLHLGAC